MSGFFSAIGLTALVVAIVSLLGRAPWAHTATRQPMGLILAAGFGMLLTGGVLACSSTPRGSAPAPSLTPSHSSPTASSAAPSHPATATSPAAPAPSGTASSPAPSRSATGSLQWQANVALPDQKLTPGAVLPAAASQVCTPGWAEAHRNVPDEVAYQVFEEYGLSYGVHHSYEVDHLIPLELGGSNSIRNLWPQPEGGSNPGYPSKDRLEDRLHQLVCTGAVPLAAAQHAIAANWWAAYQAYVGAPAPPAPTRPAPTSSPVPSSGSAGTTIVHPGAFCSPPGASGATSAGTPMTCKSTATDNRYRWRRAS
jgi:hypothetical protein